MNQETVNEYVHKHDGGICPFCGSLNIEMIDPEIWIIVCHDCRKNWRDLMQLVGIGYDGKFYLAEKK